MSTPTTTIRTAFPSFPAVFSAVQTHQHHDAFPQFSGGHHLSLDFFLQVAHISFFISCIFVRTDRSTVYRRACVFSPLVLFICRMGEPHPHSRAFRESGRVAGHACRTGRRQTHTTNARENNSVGSGAPPPSLPPSFSIAFCVFLLHQPTSLLLPSTHSLCSGEVGGGTFAHGSRKRGGKKEGKKKRLSGDRFFSRRSP